MWTLPVSFTDGTADGAIYIPVDGRYPRWLYFEERSYAHVGLNLYAPTSRRFNPTFKEKLVENEDSGSSFPHSPTK